MIFVAILVTVLVGLVLVNLSAAEHKVQACIDHQYTVDDPQFRRAMGLMMGPPIVEGNRVEELVNGDRIFPAMLEAIRAARSNVLFETFIYWSGEIGEEFAKALSERARAGVKVHVLLDWVGSAKMDDSLLDQMEAAGVEVRKYHPLRWYNLARMNNRTHRKLLIVDGKLGFTGGVGIAQQWCGDAQDAEHWRDSHFRIEGPVVSQMQSVMLDNWVNTAGTVLHGPEYFPKLEPAGELAAQMFASSPDGGSESMLMMYLLAITAATRSIDISSAYFVPDAVTRDALVAAVKRGARVRVVTPGKHTDQATVRRASRGLWGEMLQAGVEMYEYQPTMYHCKVMIVDGLMTSVGSTNFDMRSFRMNDEANLNVYDTAFAERMTKVFEGDIGRARRITYEEWLSRPWSIKLREKVAARFGSLL